METMEELRDRFAFIEEKVQKIRDINIEEVLERIEKLSSLIRRYGSIEKALENLEQRKRELKHYENIFFEKTQLKKKMKTLEKEVESLCENITSYRRKSAEYFEKEVNKFTSFLKLPFVKIKMSQKDIDRTGKDYFEVTLKDVSFQKISSGEFNRLRLAFLRAFVEFDREKKVLILDEIDANVSGKESMAIAKMLKDISKKYQIFTISHQAQLSSAALEHFLVEKKGEKSFVKKLASKERVNEIARIISGDNISKEAIEFAKKSLEKNSFSELDGASLINIV
jgi:DNA repair protein RecN (Recombination protein N)